MVKKYIRLCDNCKKEIENMYNYGVTTLFKDIRVGRGHSFHDYNKSNIRNEMNVETPEDFDGYAKGWNDDENKEFNFCSSDCLYEFLGKIYEDVYLNTVNKLKSNKIENTTEILNDIEKRKKMNPIEKFFDRSKVGIWIDGAINELKELKIDINKKLKQIESLKK